MVASRAEQATLKHIDIAVYSPDHELQLLVEVKSKTEATTEWAAHMRRNLAVHLSLPGSPYFLLALPDHFYLWKNVRALPTVTQSDYDIDPEPFLAPYVDAAHQSLRTLSDQGLMLAVSAWLTDLVTAATDHKRLMSQQRWLVDSGLCQAIQGGFISTLATV